MTVKLFLSLISVLALIVAGDEHNSTGLQIEAPKYALFQDIFSIQCKANRPIGFMVKHCKVKSKFQKKEKHGFQWNIHILANDKKACEVTCFTVQKREMKMIPVINGVITSMYHNITVSEGMPFTIACSSTCKTGFCHVAWTTNKTSAFVKTDNEHTIWSTQPHKDTQSHYLTIHSAKVYTDYQCLLFVITGGLIGSAEQRVYIKEPDNSIAGMIIWAK